MKSLFVVVLSLGVLTATPAAAEQHAGLLGKPRSGEMSMPTNPASNACPYALYQKKLPEDHSGGASGAKVGSDAIAKSAKH